MRLSLEISEIKNRMLASDFEVAAYIGDAAVERRYLQRSLSFS